MTIKPILFNTPMTQAVRAGAKTETRRNINPAPVFVEGGEFHEEDGKFNFHCENGLGSWIYAVTPPYKPGDILYVRETWKIQSARRFDADVRVMFKSGGPMSTIQFSGSRSWAAERDEYDAFVTKWTQSDCWHPSIHMPRAAARTFLRVTDLRVQRLREITNDEALAEGIRCYNVGMGEAAYSKYQSFEEAKNHPFFDYPTGAFADLWDDTVKRDCRDFCGWSANPWVWVFRFELCQKPEVAE